MPTSTLGKKHENEIIVKATPNIFCYYRVRDYAAIPGVTAGDLTAVGHQAIGSNGAGTIVVAGANAPKPARFRKKLSGTNEVPTTQEYLTVVGNGVDAAQITTAAQAGWRITTPYRLCSFGDSAKSKNVAIQLSNGVYAVRHVATASATEENATLFGWQLTMSDTLLKKAVRGSHTARPAIVKKAVNGGLMSLPCKATKIADAQAAGWRLSSPEFISDPSVIAEGE